MALELTELAAGLPMAASFAMAGGISVLRAGRRRTALNEAMHELRRPLQAIALTAPPASGKAAAFESSLQMAAAAVDRLDREINGGPAPGPIKAVSLRELVEATARRWEAAASLDDRAMNLKCVEGDLQVIGDRAEIARAVDNLISNAIVHGQGGVVVEARTVGRWARLVVVNHRSQAVGRRGRMRALRGRISGRAQHGHGLRVVRRAAARHGGGFRLRDRGGVCEAMLDLPLREVPR